MASLRFAFAFGLSVAAFTAAVPAVAQTESDQQLVIVSFDGAHDNALWSKSLDIAQATGARFTYFLSCTFLMTRQQAHSYKGPGQKAGRSNIGFAQDISEIRTRLEHIWSARENGHEMASHGCGHFDGKSWSKNQWQAEFAAFSETLRKAWHNAGSSEQEPTGWQDFVGNEISGFRAPYLSTNSNMFAALKQTGFEYDASGVSRRPVTPRTNEKLLRFDLPMIAEGPEGRRVLAMDYNLYYRHSAATEKPERSKEFEERAYLAFHRAFERERNGARNPFQIGMHFVEMNDGAYWRALERFLLDVCPMADVDCVNYRDAIERMKTRHRGDGA